VKYDVVHRGDELSARLAEKFLALASERGMMQNTEQPDLVISIGGDGTMLHAFHRYVDRLDRIAFVGVHTGHLGFYADWKANELPELVEHMASIRDAGLEEKIVRYPLVEAKVIRERVTSVHLACNELTLRGVRSMLVARVDINGSPIEMFRGDGICVSSPSGSTAYNKSLNGAIIHPSLEAIQIAEMASINNRVYRTLGSPMILPKHHHCEIVPKAGQHLHISVDHLQFEYDDVVAIRCSVSEKKVRFARFRPFPFWVRVKEAFIGADVD
jgi:Predicted sugar kinase